MPANKPIDVASVLESHGVRQHLSRPSYLQLLADLGVITEVEEEEKEASVIGEASPSPEMPEVFFPSDDMAVGTVPPPDQQEKKAKKPPVGA